MSTITNIAGSDLPSDSRGVINTNFSNLNTDKAELASPTFTGTPTLPTGTIATTQSASDNSTALATTEYVDANTNTQFDTTQVFSGTSPTSYTDLDLSSVIGATQKVVMLRVSSDAQYHTFRRKGETLLGYAGNAGFGGGGVYVPSSSYADTVTVTTNTSGVIEWKSMTAGVTTTINVEAYW